MSAQLRLRPPVAADETEFRAAHLAMLPDFLFGLGYEPDEPFDAYCRLLEDQRCGRRLAAGRVAATFLLAEIDGVIVGRASIRHALNERLVQVGGHIGYGVLPTHRRRGYGTEILRQCLIIVRSHGVARVLVTCDDDNVGSRTVIERCGGVFESHVDDENGVLQRRYWID